MLAHRTPILHAFRALGIILTRSGGVAGRPRLMGMDPSKTVAGEIIGLPSKVYRVTVEGACDTAEHAAMTGYAIGEIAKAALPGAPGVKDSIIPTMIRAVGQPHNQTTKDGLTIGRSVQTIPDMARLECVYQGGRLIFFVERFA